MEALTRSADMLMFLDACCLHIRETEREHKGSVEIQGAHGALRYLTDLNAYEYISSLCEDEIVKQFLDSMRECDPRLLEHCFSVALVAYEIAARLYFDEDKLRTTCCAALLHDVGKLYLDQTILQSDHILSPDEREHVQSHSQIGYIVLKLTGHFNEEVCNAVLMHHYTMDGTGYPEYTLRKKTSIGAEILHVADVFDAILTYRPYKECLGLDETLDLMAHDKTDSFSPKVVNVLTDYFVVED